MKRRTWLFVVLCFLLLVAAPAFAAGTIDTVRIDIGHVEKGSLRCGRGRSQRPVCVHERIKPHGGVRGARGGKLHAGDSRFRFAEATIGLSSGGTGAEDGRDGRRIHDARKVVRHGVANARVLRAFDATRGEHVPQRDMVAEQLIDPFLVRARQRFVEELREHAPEPVARMRALGTEWRRAAS